MRFFFYLLIFAFLAGGGISSQSWAAAKKPSGKELADPLCPKCHIKKNVIPIVYGLPDGSLMTRAEKGEVKLGGCVVSDHDPQWYCKTCRQQW